MNYAVAVAVFSEASRLNPTNGANVLMRATALVYQANVMNPAASAEDPKDRPHVLSRGGLCHRVVLPVLATRKLNPTM